MNCFWTAVIDHIAHNAEAYGLGSAALGIAAVKCMPRPGSSLSWLTWYTWVYDTLQTVIPAPRNSQPVPIQPVPTPAPTPTVK